MMQYDASLTYGQRFLPGTELLPTLQLPLPEKYDTDSPIVIGIASVLMNEKHLSFGRKHWHSNSHLSTRETMSDCIKHLILARRPESSAEWREKLADVSRKVEERLYISASSFEDYKNSQTLIDRLELLVQSLIAIANESKLEEESKHNEERNEFSENDEDDMDESDSDFPRNFSSSRSMKMKQKEIIRPPSNRQVSSQGCSRVFIVKGDGDSYLLYLFVVAVMLSNLCFYFSVLLLVSDYVQGKKLPSIFTFKPELVTRWLEGAKVLYEVNKP